jgi:ribosomal protein S18 acetylase RimI-like enzyme
VIVRDAVDDELDALAAAVAQQPLLGRYGTGAEKLAEGLHEACSRGELLVVEEGGRAVGLAWFLPSGTLSHGGYLRLIALAPGQEGRGLGAALLDEVERRTAERSRYLFLLVSEWNAPARRFYAARGYAEVGTLRGYGRPDADEVLCIKQLR